MTRLELFAGAVLLLCLSGFAASAQTALPAAGARDPAGAGALNPQPLPPKKGIRATRRDAAAERAIIIVSGRGRKASRKAGRHPGGPAMLNPQPLPPKPQAPKARR